MFPSSPGPHDIIATRCRARPAPRSRISALCDTSPAPQPPDQARVLAGARDLDRSDVVTTAAAATAATAATAAHVRIVVALAGARDRSSASPTAVAATATTTIDDTAADFEVGRQAVNSRQSVGSQSAIRRGMRQSRARLSSLRVDPIEGNQSAIRRQSGGNQGGARKRSLRVDPLSFCGTQHHKTLPPAIWGRA